MTIIADTSVTEISATDVTKRLTVMLNNTQYGNRRYLVKRHGKAVGAFISVEDLELLTGKKLDEITREATTE